MEQKSNRETRKKWKKQGIKRSHIEALKRRRNGKN
jgi:hypothetical protein